MGYLCANFSLLRPLCSRVRPDVRDRRTDRQTDVRKKHRLMLPPIRGEGIISNVKSVTPMTMDTHLRISGTEGRREEARSVADKSLVNSICAVIAT